MLPSAAMDAEAGTLYVVATPIGNLGDITLRALRVLKTATIIAAEDTRHTRKLLTHHGIHGQLTSYRDHNKDYKAPVLIERLQAGDSVALVSDAGTPLIADPGYFLVVSAHAEGVPVVPLPGACAAVSALSTAGLPTDSYTFIGYPPNRRAARQRRFEEFADSAASLVLYESPHRIGKCLNDMLTVFGDRQVTVSRELTKQHEEIIKSSLAEAVTRHADKTAKGEFTVVMEGLSRKERQARKRAEKKAQRANRPPLKKD